MNSSINSYDQVMDDDDDYDEEAKMPDSSQLLDRALALLTGLCYLCRIQADVAHIQDFLSHHPEAILLEGTESDANESAMSVLMQQQETCQCLPHMSCCLNRVAIQQLLKQGVPFVPSGTIRMYEMEDWYEYEGELVAYEKEIRLLRQQEFTIRQYALEAAVQINKYQDELKLAELYCVHKVKFSLFSCGKPNDELFARRSVLEYQISSAQVELQSLERLHESVLDKIAKIRQLQYGLLKHALPCAVRHACDAREAGPDLVFSSDWMIADRITVRNVEPVVSTEEYSI